MRIPPLESSVVLVLCAVILTVGTERQIRTFEGNGFIPKEVFHVLPSNAVDDRKPCEDHDCYPGECNKKGISHSCLCPEGHFSERGICKEFQWTCKVNDCKPGKCVREFHLEKCLCPEGFTVKAGRCVEIAYTSAKQVSTIMLMVIVAIASVMLTTFFGVCICYLTTRQNNYG